jgi:hypothetical protein
MKELSTLGASVAAAIVALVSFQAVRQIPAHAAPQATHALTDAQRSAMERRMDDALERMKHYDLLLTDAVERTSRLRIELRGASHGQALLLNGDLDRALEDERKLRERRGILHRIVLRTQFLLDNGTVPGADELWPETDALDIDDI